MNHEKSQMSHEEIINQIERIFENNNKLIKIDRESCELIPSKKHYILKTRLVKTNIVNYNPNSLIIIKFFNREISDYYFRCENEVHQIIKLKSIYHKKVFPLILDWGNGIILYEYIEGDSYFDLLLNKKLNLVLIKLIAEWFHTLHANNLIFGDSRLKNFILSPEGILNVIDLEDVTTGNSQLDISNLLSAFIDFTPGIFEFAKIENALHNMCLFLSYYLSLKPIHNDISKLENTEKFERHWTILITKSLKITQQRRSIKLKKSDWRKIKKTIKSSLHSEFFLDKLGQVNL